MLYSAPWQISAMLCPIRLSARPSGPQTNPLDPQTWTQPPEIPPPVSWCAMCGGTTHDSMTAVQNHVERWRGSAEVLKGPCWQTFTGIPIPPVSTGLSPPPPDSKKACSHLVSRSALSMWRAATNGARPVADVILRRSFSTAERLICLDPSRKYIESGHSSEFFGICRSIGFGWDFQHSINERNLTTLDILFPVVSEWFNSNIDRMETYSFIPIHFPSESKSQTLFLVHSKSDWRETTGAYWRAPEGQTLKVPETETPRPRHCGRMPFFAVCLIMVSAKIAHQIATVFSNLWKPFIIIYVPFWSVYLACVAIRITIRFPIFPLCLSENHIFLNRYRIFSPFVCLYPCISECINGWVHTYSSGLSMSMHCSYRKLAFQRSLSYIACSSYFRWREWLSRSFCS